MDKIYAVAGFLVILIVLTTISFGNQEYAMVNSIFNVFGVFLFIGLIGVLVHVIEWWWNDANDDGKPSDLLLCVAGAIVLIPVWLLIVIPMAFGGATWLACDVGHVSDKYFYDSPCFDFHYRCEVECSRFNLEFTGVTDGCACDCGTGWVSSCSGFYYDKGPDGQDLIRIVGDEVVEYPNGTVVPAGYEAGVYAFNKSEPMVINEEHKVS